MAEKLLIFIGRPGAGKSTLINQFSDWTKIDVLDFLDKYKVGERIPEDKTITGYNDMYEYIQRLINKYNLILELGTNHVEYNINRIKVLQNKFNITVFICEVPTKICLSRVKERERAFLTEPLLERMKRKFPDYHIKLLINNKIKYYILNMTRDIKTNKNIINKLIS